MESIRKIRNFGQDGWGSDSIYEMTRTIRFYLVTVHRSSRNQSIEEGLTVVVDRIPGIVNASGGE